MRKLISTIVGVLLFTACAFAQNVTTFNGINKATSFAYGYGSVPALTVGLPGGTAGTSYALTLNYGQITTPAGIVFNPLSVTAPISVGVGTSFETVTPTAVSCSTPLIYQTCTVTATFTYAHGTGDVVRSGTFGLQEALNYSTTGGGQAGIDSSWTALGGTSAIITAAVPWPDTTIVDTRAGATVYWNPQGGATVMTTPTTLTSSTVTAATTPAGTFANSAYTVGVACVDAMGQEGPVSTGYAITPSAGSSSLTFVAPTNCVGAVGYTIYSTLASASYPLAYEIPLVTQPTAIGANPVSNGYCTLTTIETITPACAVTNTTYNQAASNAVVTAIPVNTSPIAPQASTVSTTSVYVPNPNGRTTYSYVPSSRMSLPGVTSGNLAFPISAADATTVPSVLGTLNISPQFMNYPGRTIEICGKATTSASTATVVAISFQWDAFGQNTAGKGVVIGNLAVTPATAFATTQVDTFCDDFETTVASASATGGSINTVGGYLNTSGVSAAAAGQAAGSDATVGAVGSLNLADPARINVIYTHTTGTDGTALTLQDLTVKVIN